MAHRTDREDLSAQQQAVTDAQITFEAALNEVIRLAKAARRTHDLTELRGAWSALDRADEAFTLAAYDLHTAAGGDG